MARRIVFITIEGDVTSEQLWQELTALQELWQLDYGWEVYVEVENL